MERKHVILLGAAFLLVGVLAVTLEEAHHALDLLINTTTESSEHGMRELNKQSGEVGELATMVVSRGQQVLGEAHMRIENTYKDIHDSAETIGVNITSCTKPHMGILQELLAISQLSLVTCVTRYLDQAEITINKCYLELNTIIAEVFPLRTELNACQSTDAKCIDTVAAKINFAEFDIPRKVQESIMLGENRVEAYRLLMTECDFTEAEKFFGQAVRIIDTIQSCVNKLIEG